MKRHQDILDQLVAYMDREVSEADRRRIDDHLSGCADCRQELALLRDVITLTHEPEQLRAKTAFVQRVRERIRRRPTWLQRHVAEWMTPWVAALLIAAIGAGGLVAWRLTRSLPVVGMFERVKTASGYVTIQDRDGIRDVAKTTPLHDGTAVMTVEQQYVTVGLVSRWKATLLPFSLMIVRTAEGRGPGRVEIRYGRVFAAAPNNGKPWRLVTPHGDGLVSGGDVYIEVTSAATRLVALEGGIHTAVNATGSTGGPQVMEWGSGGRLERLKGDRAAKLTVEARLKTPLSLEDIQTIQDLKGGSLQDGLETLARVGGLPPFILLPDVPKAAAVAEDPSGFLVEDTLQNLLWALHVGYDVSARGITVRRMTAHDRALPLSWDSLPMEYRDLIKAYFEKIGQQVPRAK